MDSKLQLCLWVTQIVWIHEPSFGCKLGFLYLVYEDSDVGSDHVNLSLAPSRTRTHTAAQSCRFTTLLGSLSFASDVAMNTNCLRFGDNYWDKLPTKLCSWLWFYYCIWQEKIDFFFFFLNCKIRNVF